MSSSAGFVDFGGFCENREVREFCEDLQALLHN